MSPTLPMRAIAEAFGTFTLVMLGPGAAMVGARTGAVDHLGVSIAFGLAVCVVVATLGPVSGAHINPAVSVALWARGRLAARELPVYVVAQCVGAIAASALSGWLIGPVGDFGATVPTIPLAQAFAVEFGYSALLGVAIARVLHASRESVPAPLLLGATILAGALVTGPLTGGSFNPARSLGPALLSGVWTAHWLYWAAPIAGVTLGLTVADRGPLAPPPGPAVS